MTQAILAIETSAACCGVALLLAANGQTHLYHREHHGVQEHSARLLPMVDEVLAEAGLPRTALTAVAFGQGPGGFTGLRVACGVAQGIAFALDIPVIPVVSHEAIAAETAAEPGDRVLVLMDARMSEVYAAVYERRDEAGAFAVVCAPVLMALSSIPAWLQTFAALQGESWLAGDARQVYPEAFDRTPPLRQSPVLRPSVLALARLAQYKYRHGLSGSAEQASPLYVRDKVAFTTEERAAGAGGNPRAIQA